MSVEVHITEANHLFVGTTRDLLYPTTDQVPTGASPLGTPLDIHEWTLRWVLRQAREGAVILTKDGGSITFELSAAGAAAGLSSPQADTAIVRLAAADTAGLDSGTYDYILERTDAGFEDALAFGMVTLKGK